MSKPVVISGEASETDSEDESSKKTRPHAMTSSIQGAVITGEDSESENENDASICSAVSALNDLNIPGSPTKETPDKLNSLLHQKLRECNGRLQQDLDSFCQSIIADSGKTLNAIDQQLIRSQLTVQSAVTSLKSLNATSLSLKNKLQSLLSAHFIPNINVDK